MKYLNSKKIERAIFTTRKDFTFILSIIFFIFFFLCLVVFGFIKERYLLSCVSLILSFLLFLNLVNNKIVLERYYLCVHFGIFNYKIKYKDIKDIYLDYNTYGFLSSSHFKVGIKTSQHKGKLFDTFLSPMDRADFIYEVNKRR